MIHLQTRTLSSSRTWQSSCLQVYHFFLSYFFHWDGLWGLIYMYIYFWGHFRTFKQYLEWFKLNTVYRVMYTGSEIKAHLRFLQAVWYGIVSPWYRTGPPPYPTTSDVTYKRNIVFVLYRPMASVEMTSIAGSTLTSYPPFSLPPLACLSWRILMRIPINLWPRIHNSG